MSTIVKPYTFTAGTKIIAAEHNANFDTLYADYNGGITNANISGSAAIADSKLAQIATASKISGAAITGLASVPSSAGYLSTINLGSGTTAGLVFLKGDGTWVSIDTGIGATTGNMTGLSPVLISGGSGATFTTVSVSISTGDLTVKSPLAISGGTQSMLYSAGLSITTANLTGTANQVLVSGGSGSIMASTTLSLPQSIDTAATVTFSKVNATTFAGAMSASYLDVLSGISTAAGVIPYANLNTNLPISAVEFVIDGGGSDITTGTKGYLEVPFSCMITSFTALANTTGNIAIDIKKCTYANFPTTTSITSGGATITAGVSTQNTILTNWALVTSAGSILEFYASGCSNISNVTASLKVVKL